MRALPPAATAAVAATALLAGPALHAATAEAGQRLGARTVVRGHQGTDVRQLQRLLTQLGHRTTVDGVFGRQTHRNVHRYERRHRLAVDGRVSPGQARGMYRRAGRPVPRSFGRVAAAAPRAAPTAPLGFPVAGKVTWGEGFGTRGGRHQGVDLLAACGLPVVATVAGTITRRATHGSAGRYLVLRGETHDDAFMHLQDVDVHTGAVVAAGQRLATVGRTGNATTCHLHFERWEGGWQQGRPIDPGPALRAAQAGRG
jgi:murein DD-endopeptidase MepM/ murein hydrolase activator NlpD